MVHTKPNNIVGAVSVNAGMFCCLHDAIVDLKIDTKFRSQVELLIISLQVKGPLIYT